MGICNNCCPTLRHASWQSCTVGASTVPVWHIHGMHKHSWWGTVFRGCRAKLQWWSVEEWMDWMMDGYKEMMSFWERKAISSLKIKMLDLVMSEICWKESMVLRRQADVMVTSGLALGIGTHAGMVEAFRFFSSNVPFVGCFAIKLWDNNFDNKMRRASSTFRLLFSNSIFDWHCQKCRGLYTAVQGVDLGLLKNHAWCCACLWVALPCVRMLKDPWNNWCNKKTHTHTNLCRS